MNIEIMYDEDMLERAFKLCEGKELTVVQTVRGVDTNIKSYELSDDEQSEINWGEGYVAMAYTSRGERVLLRFRNLQNGDLTVTCNSKSVDAIDELMNEIDPFDDEHDSTMKLEYTQL